ncbi:cation-translocating P-type ATPase [Marinobacter persicus]|uniref:P-type E1-E2 ATPase n=1 Tax=Marinobacter persicus TaxID=930118 RepID=A0A2S6G2U8_9GAMM|nr:HAD-IC family P-type ATPase [Marinobacter persicus]PPK50183.1 P-type E1-E2 ATPase [Marinobacter persicus]PPK52640.1 P-type E1-E2 ATPase [Marinobacter persicus]PPK56712.1 P-type E1-E2 ATPase [Marinobacter persicus]
MNSAAPEPPTTPEPDNNGLSSQEASARLETFGYNQLPAPPMPGVVELFGRQFLSPFIYILLIASGVSFALGQNPSGVFILIVLLINAIIGTVQEFSAQKAAAALKQMMKGTAHVLRDGQIVTVDVEEIVPGDVVLLSSGDKLPADIQLLSASSLAVDESMLTGESLAVAKNAGAASDDSSPLTDRVDQCFAGSIITHGRGRGRVTATASNTQLGKIAQGVTGKTSAEPPLMIRIRKFTYQVAFGILLAIAALAGLMILDGGYSIEDMVLMTIGLAVSVIPEGLPAALTVALAIGMSRMAKLNVIIRKLVAVEALGSCTLICSDKTGTLTVNELTIRKVMLPDGRQFDVSGEGVAPGGEIQGLSGTDPDTLRELCVAGVLANESHLDYSGGEWVSQGDIVDIAFLVMAKKLDMSITDLRTRQEQVALIPYESEKAYSGVVNRVGDQTLIYAKGSPEKMLAMCNRMATSEGSTEIDKPALESQFTELASRGYRIIALAKKASSAGDHEMADMVFLGMVAMIDPLRHEAFDAIEKCRTGGIEVAMVTGDHPATAKSIALELGLCSTDSTVVTGPMLDEASTRGQAAVDQLIRPARVFARIEPARKAQIVDSFMRDGHFVAVTGDGVNDAPAMRQAHAGIAMGKRGTDVAKETADLIVTDDNFSSIVAGIEQGRVVYNNIRKVIGLLVATGFSAILLFFFCVLGGLPMPMIAVQLLWLNLVANGFQDVALAFEPKEGGELSVKPRSPQEPVFDKHIIEHVLVVGSWMGLVAFLNFQWTLGQGQSIEEARNLTLMLMVLFGNIHALNSRSEFRSLFKIPLLRNPFLMLAVPLAQLAHIGAMYTPGLSDVLQIQPISLQEWLQLLAFATSLLVVEELHKVLIRRRRTSSSAAG